MAGWMKLPSTKSPAGPILHGDVVTYVSKARLELDGDLHRALSIQATKARMTLKDYVTSLLSPKIEQETWDYLGIDPGEG